MSRQAKQEPMVLLILDHQPYLMPQADGLKVMQLLTGAARCDFGRWDDRLRAETYVVRQPPSVEMKTVRPEQLEFPEGEIFPVGRRAPRSPRQISENKPKLT